MKNLIQLVEEYAQAKVDESWKGNGEKESYKEIDDRVADAREALYKALEKNTLDKIMENTDAIVAITIMFVALCVTVGYTISLIVKS